MTLRNVVVGYRRFGRPCWKRRQKGPPKRRYPIAVLHGVTTQKTNSP